MKSPRYAAAPAEAGTVAAITISRMHPALSNSPAIDHRAGGHAQHLPATATEL